MSLVARKSSLVVWGDSSVPTSRNSSVGGESETEYLTHFDRSKKLTGSNQAVCKTEAEYKAGKLNRTEEVRLQNFKYQVAKAQEIQRRQYQHTENILRVKSAKLATRIKGIEDNWTQSQQKSPLKSKLLPKRRDDSDLSQVKCQTCAQLQTVIELYEREGRHKGLIERTNVHSTCIFSNVQFKMFLKLLEAKYLQEIPGLKIKLRDNDATSVFIQTKNEPKFSRHQVDTCLAFRDVEKRIRKFCVDLEQFNKRHGAVSSHVRESVERVRLSNAVVKRDGPEPKLLNMREEVQRVLRL